MFRMQWRWNLASADPSSTPTGSWIDATVCGGGACWTGARPGNADRKPSIAANTIAKRTGHGILVRIDTAPIAFLSILVPPSWNSTTAADVHRRRCSLTAIVEQLRNGARGDRRPPARCRAMCRAWSSISPAQSCRRSVNTADATCKSGLRQS